MTLTKIVPTSLLALIAACTITPQREALSTAEQYAAALTTNDVDSVVAMTDPILFTRIERPEFRRIIAEILDPTNSEARLTSEEVRSVSPAFTDSVGMHYFVETTRTNKQADGSELHMDNYYVLTSRDFGKQWTVLDLACVDERWVRAVAPGWTGFPQLPEQRVRLLKVESLMKKYAPATP